MNFFLELQGNDTLAMKLYEKSREDFTSVTEKNVRDIYARSQQPGGTPVDTNELRMSATYRADEMGYNASYGPHVEYGHLTRGGTYVPGQNFLKRNVDTQRPIYRQDMLNKLRE